MSEERACGPRNEAPGRRCGSETTANPSRRFRHQRLLAVTVPAYEQAVRLLATSSARFAPISAVIGIANGGLTPASGISGALDLPSYRITAKHNPTDAIYTEATGHVTVNVDTLAADLNRRKLTGTVLLVDDICGSGATFTAVLPTIGPHLRPDTVIRTMALCRNAGTSLDPDLWVWTVDDWVQFPWEPPPRPGVAIEELPMPTVVEPA